MTGPTVGSQVSHYRLERVLGAGGMGQVFLARDLTLDRPVAIKFLIAVQDETARKRLLAEARSVAALDHPAICTVHEVVTDDEAGDFIVMNYIEGETLGARLRRGRLTPTETLAIMVPLLQALGTAHRAGIVHRDIKPHNIILTPSGMPKLLDFGIAKRVHPEGTSEDATTASMLTGDGDIAGTLAYMSPEQIQGRPVDARSDLFALGCVLYECLTGNRTFAGSSRAETIGALLHVDPPAPSSVVPELGPMFDTLCADLLRKAPAERFQSAEEVLGTIRSLSPTARIPRVSDHAAAPIVKPGLSSWQWAAVAAAVTALAALVVPWLLRGTSLPAADPNAVRWFNIGVEKLREGSYTGAYKALEEAVRVSPDFALAHLRLAEAQAELDNSGGARASWMKADGLLPKNVRLRKEDQLRLDAVRWSVLRDHAKAISAYQQLADLEPSDASRWLDVGRAEEAAGRRVAALKHFEQAVKLNAQYAAAHQRLGVVQSQGGLGTVALASLDEAIRLHQAASNPEGEAEATLRKAIVHIARRESEAARLALARVGEIANDPNYVSLRLRAEFEKARVELTDGRVEEAAALSRKAVDEAINLNMGIIAADGLRGLATALTVAGRFEDADAQFVRAIDLAQKEKAARVEMQARLQQASLRLAENRYADAISIAEGQLKFVTEDRYVRNEAEAKSILARAHEGLEHYDEARRLTSEGLALAESMDDVVLTGVSLENLAGQAERLGRLPEALSHRERLEKLHRDNNDQALLAFDLVNRAHLLILLGRSGEGEVALAQLDKAIAGGREDYKSRLPRMTLMRALRASIEGRYGEVEPLALVVSGPTSAPRTGDNALYARVLAEHAQARLGRSRTPVAEIAAWPSQTSSASLGRELTYWVARTLIERRRFDLAYQISRSAWDAAPARTNLELRWRLAALAAQASTLNKVTPEAASGATMRTSARDELQALLVQWAQAGDTYIARPDLTALRKGIS